MQTIYTSDDGNTFVGKLNSNFGEHGGGGIMYTFDDTVDLIGGSIDHSTGYIKGSITTDTQFTQYKITGRYICFNGDIDKLNTVTLDAGETLTIFCYTKAKTFISAVDTLSSIPSTTAFIKFELHKSSAYVVGRVLALNITTDSPRLRYSYNEKVGEDPKFLSFGVDLNLLNDEGVSDGTYNAPTSYNAFDNGYLWLPPNYTEDGKKVKLVLKVHGTGGYTYSETELTLYKDLNGFIVKNGYALADCSGMTNLYGNDTNTNGIDFKNSPIGLSCFVSFAKYIGENYNVEIDSGVYVCGKSAGGMLSSLMGLLQPIKVKCVGGLAPSLAMIAADMRYCDKKPLNFELKMFGCVSPNVSQYLGGSGDYQYIYDNISKFVGYDPLFVNSDMPFLSTLQTMMTYDFRSMSQTDVWAIINASHKIQPCPIKIWHAQDDNAVPYATSQFYKKLVDNGNGICKLRTMPSGTGGHSSVDTSANAPKTDYQTKYGGVVNIPVAYAELVDWFNRW